MGVFRQFQLVLDHHYGAGTGLPGDDVHPPRASGPPLRLFEVKRQFGAQQSQMVCQPWCEVPRLIGPSLPYSRFPVHVFPAQTDQSSLARAIS